MTGFTNKHMPYTEHCHICDARTLILPLGIKFSPESNRADMKIRLCKDCALALQRVSSEISLMLYCAELKKVNHQMEHLKSLLEGREDESV
jgi:hypothetical protein